ncbi:hypothetical protein HPB50_026876 [Hyalomma asiaticum]|uniref:Uncharacterized protein n=1 Tax=Hyalomma asiaticum TaxID=266040 RepID=A0ACB7TRU8_HYAAI|nr:hypothetical protein HPB50_026876 [Hyalomma asiaticum]
MEHHGNPDDLNPGLTQLQPATYLRRGLVGAATTITLLQLWLADPALWFNQAENKFRINRVTSEVRKYGHLLEPLPQQAMADIHSIL